MRDNIDEALWNMPIIDVPLSTLEKVDNVLANLGNRKVEKNKVKLKSFLTIAAVITVLAALCGTALAAAGIIDFGKFYNSIFSNPDASPYVSTNDMISISGGGDDLLIEPIAGFIAGEGNLYIQLKLTALNDIPLPETLYILNGNHVINLGDVVISKVDERTAIISFRTHDGRRDSESEMISLKFDAVSSVPMRIDNNGEPDSAPIVSICESDSLENAITYSGQWEVLVSSNSIIETRYVDGNFEEREARVRIEATVVEIQVFGNEYAPFLVDSSGSINYRFDSKGTIRITLVDGRVIENSMVESEAGAGSNNDAVDEHGNRDYGMASYWCSIEFINPADVIGIELFGEQVFSASDR
jgi:hypothetical protein